MAAPTNPGILPTTPGLFVFQGKVSDTQGKGIPGLVVRAVIKNDAEPGIRANLVGQAVLTDEEGNYVLGIHSADLPNPTDLVQLAVQNPQSDEYKRYGVPRILNANRTILAEKYTLQPAQYPLDSSEVDPSQIVTDALQNDNWLSDILSAALRRALCLQIIDLLQPLTTEMKAAITSNFLPLKFENLLSTSLAEFIFGESSGILGNETNVPEELYDEFLQIQDRFFENIPSESIQSLLKLSSSIANCPHLQVYRQFIPPTIEERKTIAELVTGFSPTQLETIPGYSTNGINRKLVATQLQPSLNENGHGPGYNKKIQKLLLSDDLKRIGIESISLVEALTDEPQITKTSLTDFSNKSEDEWKTILANSGTEIPYPYRSTEELAAGIVHKIKSEFKNQLVYKKITSTEARIELKPMDSGTPTTIGETINLLQGKGSLLDINPQFCELPADLSPQEIEEKTTEIKNLFKLKNKYRALGFNEILEDEETSLQAKGEQIDSLIDKLDNFLSRNADRDIENEDWIKNADELDWTGISEENGEKFKILNQVLAVQRAGRLAGNPEDSEKLLEAGFDSSLAISLYPEEVFVAQAGINPDRASEIYQVAQAQAAGAQNVYQGYAAAYADSQTAFGTKYLINKEALKNELSKIPGYDSFFGAQSYTAPKSHESMLSPAAYFVDLMQFVRFNLSTNVWRVPQETRVPNVTLSPLYLKNRRPDLWEIVLNESSTNSLVPYLQIVVGVLQNYVANTFGPNRPFPGIPEITTNTNSVYTSLSKSSNYFGSTKPKPGIGLPKYLGWEEMIQKLNLLGINATKVSKNLPELHSAEKEMQYRIHLGISELTRSQLTTSGSANIEERLNLSYNGNNIPLEHFLRVFQIDRKQLEEIINVVSLSTIFGPISIINAAPEADKRIGIAIYRISGFKNQAVRLDTFFRFYKWTQELKIETALLDKYLCAVKRTYLSGISESEVENLDAKVFDLITKLLYIKELFDLNNDETISLICNFSEAESNGFPFDSSFLNSKINFDELTPGSSGYSRTSDLLKIASSLGLSLIQLRFLFDNTPFSLSTNGLSQVQRMERYSGLHRIALLISKLSLTANQLRRIFDQYELGVMVGSNRKISITNINDYLLILNGSERISELALSEEEITHYLTGKEDKNNGTAYSLGYKEAKEILDVLNSFDKNDTEQITPYNQKLEEAISNKLGINLEDYRALKPWIPPASATFTLGALELGYSDLTDKITGVYMPEIEIEDEIDIADPVDSEESAILTGPTPSSKRMVQRAQAIRNSAAPTSGPTGLKPARPAIPSHLNTNRRFMVWYLRTCERIMGLFKRLEAPFPLQLLVLRHRGLVNATDILSLNLTTLQDLVWLVETCKPHFNEGGDAQIAVDLLVHYRRSKGTSGYPTPLVSAIARHLAVEEDRVLGVLNEIPNLATGAGELRQAYTRAFNLINLADRLDLEGELLFDLVPFGDSQGNETQTITNYEKTLATVNQALNLRYPNISDRERALENITDHVLEQKRDVLCAFILANRDKLGFDSQEELYYYFLLDPLMTAKVKTSLLVAAHNSVQLYVQRCNLGLEKTETERVRPLNPKKLKEWEWRKSYRLWEANRKVFLWPENYLDPDFLQTKSPEFDTLLENYRQGKLSEGFCKDLLFKYLQTVSNYSDLKIVDIASYDEYRFQIYATEYNNSGVIFSRYLNTQIPYISYWKKISNSGLSKKLRESRPNGTNKNDSAEVDTKIFISNGDISSLEIQKLDSTFSDRRINMLFGYDFETKRNKLEQINLNENTNTVRKEDLGLSFVTLPNRYALNNPNAENHEKKSYLLENFALRIFNKIYSYDGTKDFNLFDARISYIDIPSEWQDLIILDKNKIGISRIAIIDYLDPTKVSTYNEWIDYFFPSNETETDPNTTSSNIFELSRSLIDHLTYPLAPDTVINTYKIRNSLSTFLCTVPIDGPKQTQFSKLIALRKILLPENSLSQNFHYFYTSSGPLVLDTELLIKDTLRVLIQTYKIKIFRDITYTENLEYFSEEILDTEENVEEVINDLVSIFRFKDNLGNYFYSRRANFVRLIGLRLLLDFENVFTNGNYIYENNKNRHVFFSENDFNGCYMYFKFSSYLLESQNSNLSNVLLNTFSLSCFDQLNSSQINQKLCSQLFPFSDDYLNTTTLDNNIYPPSDPNIPDTSLHDYWRFIKIGQYKFSVTEATKSKTEGIELFNGVNAENIENIYKFTRKETQNHSEKLFIHNLDTSSKVLFRLNKNSLRQNHCALNSDYLNNYSLLKGNSFNLTGEGTNSLDLYNNYSTNSNHLLSFNNIKTSFSLIKGNSGSYIVCIDKYPFILSKIPNLPNQKLRFLSLNSDYFGHAKAINIEDIFSIFEENWMIKFNEYAKLTNTTIKDLRQNDNINFINLPPLKDDLSKEFDHFFGINGFYFDEIYFHFPFMIAKSYMEDEKFQEAKTWIERIFNPFADVKEIDKSAYWTYRKLGLINSVEDVAFKRFMENRIYSATANGPIYSASSFQAGYDIYLEDPFNPFLIAQARGGLALKKAAFFLYVENLIRWGDSLFRRDTMESINEALLYYTMASDLLGPRPSGASPAELADEELRKYSQVERSTSLLSNDFMILLENMEPPDPTE